MGALIHLAVPAPAGQDAGRVYYGVGRSLTAADFAQQGRYNEARLLGLTTGTTGVIAGLGVSPARFDSANGTTGLTSLTIGVGSGIGADGRVVRVTTPISIAWTDLVAAVTNSGTLANGWYFLLARTVSFDGLEGSAPDPSQRAANDPMLDIRQDSFVEVWLSSSVGALPATRTAPALALALNTLIGGLSATSLANAIGNGVPLAIVLVLNGQAILLSQAAGRLPAESNGLNAMLLGQMREAFAMALTETGANPALGSWQTGIRARFRFLPGAGELPVGMLLTPEAVTASCPFFPQGMAVYLELIRASQAAHLLYEALGRSQIDLASNNAEAVTLALGIPDGAWTPDLLDIPRGDPVLAADTHLAYARARVAQVAQRENWIAVYGGMTTVVAAQAQAIGFLMAADAAARNISYLLTLPPPPAPALPVLTVAGLLAAADNAASPLCPASHGCCVGDGADRDAAGGDPRHPRRANHRCRDRRATDCGARLSGGRPGACAGRSDGGHPRAGGFRCGAGATDPVPAGRFGLRALVGRDIGSDTRSGVAAAADRCRHRGCQCHRGGCRPRRLWRC